MLHEAVQHARRSADLAPLSPLLLRVSRTRAAWDAAAASCTDVPYPAGASGAAGPGGGRAWARKGPSGELVSGGVARGTGQLVAEADDARHALLAAQILAATRRPGDHSRWSPSAGFSAA